MSRSLSKQGTSMSPSHSIQKIGSSNSISRLRQQEATAGNVASPKGISQKKISDRNGEELQVVRRRLSVVSDNKLVEGMSAVSTTDCDIPEDGISSIGRYAGVSKKGYAPYNPRKKNQDSMIMKYHAPTKSLLLCVFDGHGEAGDGVSQYFKAQLPDELFNHSGFACTGDLMKDRERIECAYLTFFYYNTLELIRLISGHYICVEFRREASDSRCYNRY